MIRTWMAAHKSAAATVISGTAIAALVATVAVVSTGYTSQRMDLDDGAVWVANGADNVIGRANTQIFELNTIVGGEGNDLSVVQDAESVLLVDRTNASLDAIDPATSEAGDTIALPPEQPQVFLAGDNVVIQEEGTGEVWIMSRADLAGFDPLATATRSFGRGAAVAVDDAGTLWAFRPDDSQLFQIDATRGDVVVAQFSVDLPEPSGDFEVTAASGRWAVLDTGTRRLATAGQTVDLSEWLAADSAPHLQAASSTGSRLLVAHAGGLLGVPFDGADPTVLLEGRSGRAAAPLVALGCSFSAWTDGTALRRCGGEPTELSLEGMGAGADLVLSRRNGHVLLNDVQSGASWAVQGEGELIDNWADLIVDDTRQEEAEDNDEDTPPDVEEQQQPPVAVDDAFGARPGTATPLPVLLNDYDPNGDVLVVSAVTPIDEAVGRVDRINRNQQVQITLEPTATGVVTFEYTIDDGRGGEATAQVTVDIRSDAENAPPQQVRTSKTTVQSAGRVETQVLGDWVDPDGDPVYLVSASSSGDGDVTWKPDGTVIFRDNGDGGDLKNVTLVVSDGSAVGNGSLAVTVRPAGEVPIIADPFVVQTYAGESVTVRPLEHVRGGNGTIRLNAVPAKAGVSVEPSFQNGTFSFETDQVRTHYLEYVVTDDEQTATGLVRVDVAVPPEAGARPITVPKTVFVTSSTQETVDVAATDIDPAGGVLLVTDVDDLPEDEGVRAEVLDQKSVRVTLTGPLDAPRTFGYTVSNGVADAPGTITVIEIPRPAQLQPPLAVDDTATARVGDVIDIPVLDNDEQPDGFDISLVPDLAEDLPEGGGLLFASGDRLRYLAPDNAGNYSAVYAIEGPGGQRAEARVTISVRERNAATNSAPVPRTVSARVIAGSRITIDVPLNGIDPDGDAVQLLGVERSPEKGAVTETGDDGFVYEAGAYSSGTDTFTYTVVDGLGARATGTVRVGISPRAEGGRNPVANEDEVRVRPGKTVSVRVLENDSDPDGSALRVDAVQPQQPGVEAQIVEDQIVDITPPAETGSYSILYTISNEFGGTSQNFVQVRVDPDAPLSQPIASDAVLGVRDVIGRETIGVDVLDGVFFADGSSSELGVGVVPGYGDSAEVESDKRIRVTMRDQSQIIPFYVSHPDDDQVRGYGFIRVPGLEEALPQIDPDARALRVLSEDTLTIDLNDHVVALGSSRVRLTDSASVRATHANGDELVVDDDTLRYTSAPQFFGPASITFEVTDGTAADDPDGRTAILTLPIIVEARENQPPSFVGSEVAFEPGQQRELDLLRLTNYPHPEDLAELVYQVLDPAPVGFTYSLNGQRLVVTADADAAIGSDTSIVIGVRDASAAGEAGRVRLSVVPSTRPLAQPSADVAIVERGSTSTIDVLANDEVTNPFPGEPLTVVAVRGLEGGSLPAGVRITPSADNARLTVTVAADAAPTDANLQYRVADATGDPSRYVWGSVQISVQDRPDPVSNVRVTEFGDRQLRLTWGTGAFNNSPITEYRVQMTSASDGGTISTTTCSGAASCTVQTPGNGPSNAVRLAVSAVNGIGPSDASTTSGSIWSDIIPPQPVALGSTPLDQGLRVTWRKPEESSRASPISFYVVTVGGVSQNVAVSESDPAGTLYSRSIDAGLTNGSETLYTVSARNSAPNSLATWNSASGTGRPAGPPVRTSGISASSPEGGGTTASVSWSGAFDANGRAIEDYYAVAYTGSTPACVVEGVNDGSPRITAPTGASVRRADGSTTSTTLSGLSANTVYSIAVFAYNGQGCTASSAVAITPRVAPGTVTAIDVEAPDPARSGTTYDSRLRGLTIPGGNGDVSTFVYRLVGSGVDGSESPQRSLRGDPVRLVTANGSHYGKDLRVQVKACATYSEGLFCSESWSTAFPLPTAVNTDILSAVTQTFDADTVPQTGRWTWSASYPSGYSGVTATCDRGETSQPVASGAGACEVTFDILYVPGITPMTPLTITITANGQQFTRTYPGSPDPNPITSPNE